MLIIKHAKKSFSKEETKKIGDKIGVDWDKIDLDELVLGMAVELEHGTVDQQTNITDDDPVKTCKIALIHLKECANGKYYTYLKKLEKEDCKKG